MVTSNKYYLIDTTFLLKKCKDEFLGVELFQYDKQNISFLFGFMRDLLRLRCSLAINQCLLVFAKETLQVLSEKEFAILCKFMKEVDIPYRVDLEQRMGRICTTLIIKNTIIITQEISLLQFTEQVNVYIAWPLLYTDINIFSSQEVHRKYGISPKYIPSLIALSTFKPGLTKIQSCRLIKSYGNVLQIHDQLKEIPKTIRIRIINSYDSILHIFEDAKESCLENNKNHFSRLIKYEIQLNDSLEKYGFHSLIRLTGKKTVIPALRFDKPEKNILKYKLVLSSTVFKEFKEFILKSNIVAIDTETDSKDPRHANLFCISCSFDKQNTFIFPFIPLIQKQLTNEEIAVTLTSLFKKSQIKVIGHNFKYDQLVLSNHGIKCGETYFDTMLAAQHCYGDLDFLNLKYLAQLFLNKKILAYGDIAKKGKTSIDISFEKLLEHTCDDTETTIELYHFLKNELNKRDILNDFHKTTIHTLNLLTRLEMTGIKIDTEKILSIRREMFNDLTFTQKAIHSKCGVDFEITVNKDLKKVLIQNLGLVELKSQKISQRVLEELGIHNEKVRAIVIYRRLHRKLSKLDDLINSLKSSMLFPIFNQIKSKAVRVTSSKPNILDLFHSDEYRNCFSRKVHPFILNKHTSFKLLGDLSTSKKAMTLLEQKQSIILKKTCNGLYIDLIEFLLKLITGVIDQQLSKYFMIDLLTVSSLKNLLKNQYPKVFYWKEEQAAFLLKNGYVLFRGQKRYFEGSRSSNLQKRNESIDHAIMWLIRWDN